MLRRLCFLAATGALLLATACSSGGGGREPGGGQELTRAGEVDGITVEATWLTERDLSAVDADLGAYSLTEYVLLELTLDTHSGDLNEIDLERAPVLRQGTAELRPEAWVSVSDDSHHRAGVLAFSGELGDGPVELTLTIQNQELVLLWEAVPLS